MSRMPCGGDAYIPVPGVGAYPEDDCTDCSRASHEAWCGTGCGVVAKGNVADDEGKCLGPLGIDIREKLKREELEVVD